MFYWVPNSKYCACRLKHALLYQPHFASCCSKLFKIGLKILHLPGRTLWCALSKRFLTSSWDNRSLLQKKRWMNTILTVPLWQFLSETKLPSHRTKKKHVCVDSLHSLVFRKKRKWTKNTMVLSRQNRLIYASPLRF